MPVVLDFFRALVLPAGTGLAYKGSMTVDAAAGDEGVGFRSFIAACNMATIFPQVSIKTRYSFRKL